MVFSFSLVLFEKFVCQGYPSYRKLAIIKHRMTDWSSRDGKMMSHKSFKLRFYNRSLDTDGVY